MKPFIIIIYGKSSTGKDTLMDAILKETNFHKVLRTTTRPQREGEPADRYEFLSAPLVKEKAKILAECDFIECENFRGWLYGTKREQIQPGVNIMTGSIEIVETLQKKNSNEYHIFPVYLDLDDKTRMYRALKREANPDMHEVCRRFVSEIEQYQRIEQLSNKGLILDARKTTEQLKSELLSKFFIYATERENIIA